MNVGFEWVLTAPGLDTLKPDWQRLDVGGPGAIFRSWEWQATWWRVLGEERRRSLRVLVVREDGRVAAILPLYVEDASAGARRLRLLADGVVGSDYLGLVAPPHDAARLAKLIAARLVEDPLLGDVDLIQLNDLAEDDPLASALLETEGLGEPTSGMRYVCPHARWDEGAAAYLASRWCRRSRAAG